MEDVKEEGHTRELLIEEGSDDVEDDDVEDDDDEEEDDAHRKAEEFGESSGEFVLYKTFGVRYSSVAGGKCCRFGGSEYSIFSK